MKDDLQYIFVFVRLDMPVPNQMAQVCHVAQESGSKFGCPPNCHVVVCGVKDEHELINVSELCLKYNIEYCMFYEPHPPKNSEIPIGNSAICTEPIDPRHKKCFSKFKLWV